MTEEQVGPTVSVSIVDIVEDAIARAENTEYGLVSSVWPSDYERAFSVAIELEAGYTFINTHNVDGPGPRCTIRRC